jgi:RNA polymerase sigma-70 factor (ECF subfamily)
MFADKKASAVKAKNLRNQHSGETASGTCLRAAAVKQLFDDHNRALISFLHARLHNEDEARDVAQEAYVRLLELDNLDAIGFVRAYLFRIAANLAIDRLRHRGSRETAMPGEFFETLSDERSPERIAIAAEQLALVRTVVLELPDNCRRAFVWHVFGGQSTVDIGARLSLSDRMIRIYIAEALTLCRARIKSMAPNHAEVPR